MMINKKHMAFSCNDRIKMRVKRENLLLFSHKHTQKKSPNIIRRFVNPLAKKSENKKNIPIAFFSAKHSIFLLCYLQYQ